MEGTANDLVSGVRDRMPPSLRQAAARGEKIVVPNGMQEGEDASDVALSEAPRPGVRPGLSPLLPAADRRKAAMFAPKPTSRTVSGANQ